MDENLVGFLLNALDTDSHQKVEGYLHDNPAAQQRLDLLRRALDPLAADRDEIAPPPGLASRAIARVAEYRCRPLPEPPVAPPVVGGAGHSHWWRRTDFLVAASIFLVLSGISFQGITQLRAYGARGECADNLRNFHQALMTYSNQTGGDLPGVPLVRHPEMAPPLPEVPVQPDGVDPRFNRAGVYVLQLRDSGCLGKAATVRCPANGPKALPTPSWQDLQNLSPADYEQAVRHLSRCYAYSLGYRGPTGEHCGLRRDLIEPDLVLDRLPIMADCPTVLPAGGRGNSRNHSGGQNVLFLGGNVRFCSSPTVGINGDNIYVNKDGKVAAGVDRWDTVLGASGDAP